jgi:hypothetical protein
MKKIAVFALLIVACMSGFAQDKYFYINLDVNMPLSNTEWISSTSATGLRAGYRVFVNEKFSAGLDISWATFDQYLPTQTIENGNGAITTDYFKYLYSYSAAASGQYNFRIGESESFSPYVGIGLGAMRNEYVLYYNIYNDTEQSWGFLARPETGLLVKFGRRRSVGAMAAIHYDFTTNKSEKFNYNSFSALGFQVGLIFTQ